MRVTAPLGSGRICHGKTAKNVGSNPTASTRLNRISGIAQFGAERSRGGVHDDGIALLNMTEGFRKSLNCYVL